MKITGFDEIGKKASQLEKFSEDIDGDLASVSFDPKDPASIEAALQKINDVIDAKTKSYEGNDWVNSIAAQLKENARESVLEQAASARMENND